MTMFRSPVHCKKHLLARCATCC